MRDPDTFTQIPHHISMAVETLHLTVRGMTCGNCARSVERKLSATPGVTKATVDLNGAAADVEYDVGPGEARSAGGRGPQPGLRSGGMRTAAAERVDLPVSGMTCAACARTIERTLSATAGVERASVNLATNTATVEYDPARAGVSDFVGAIEDLGYGVPETEPPPDDGEDAVPPPLDCGGRCSPLPVVVLGMLHARAVGPAGADAAGDLLRRARRSMPAPGARCAIAAPT